MPDVVQYCQHAVVLDHGRMLFYGPASEAVKRYYLLEQHDRVPAVAQRPRSALPPQDAPPPHGATSAWPSSHAFLDLSNVSQVSNGWARCIGVAACNREGQPCRSFRQGETISIFYEFEMLRDTEVPIGGTVIQNDKGVLVHGKNTLQYDSTVPAEVSEGSSVRFRQDITLDIAVGEYTFEVGLATIGHDDYMHRAAFSSAELRNKIIRLCHLPAVGTFAVLPRKDASIKPPHHGIADLPGECLVSVRPPIHFSTPEQEHSI
jgi:lipopolysaccharide transport system ATP-binding protein